MRGTRYLVVGSAWHEIFSGEKCVVKIFSGGKCVAGDI